MRFRIGILKQRPFEVSQLDPRVGTWGVSGGFRVGLVRFRGWGFRGFRVYASSLQTIRARATPGSLARRFRCTNYELAGVSTATRPTTFTKIGI